MDKIIVARHECKYWLRPSQVEPLRRHLLRYCDPDINAAAHGDWYTIRSLYLDADDYRLYHDTENKRPFRFKLRARGYGNPDSPVKLEVKRRLREQIIKTSALLRPEQWQLLQQSGLAALAPNGNAALNEFLQTADSMHATPKMLVSYERLAFTSYVDDYVRVTIDRRMMAQPSTGWDLQGDHRQWLGVDSPTGFGDPDSGYVLELKFVAAPPVWLQDMVGEFGLIRRGYSKYGRAIERAIYYREAAWDMRAHTAYGAYRRSVA